MTTIPKLKNRAELSAWIRGWLIDETTGDEFLETLDKIGLVIVPRNPTEEMGAAAYRESMEGSRELEDEVRDIWLDQLRAAIGASPFRREDAAQ